MFHLAANGGRLEEVLTGGGMVAVTGGVFNIGSLIVFAQLFLVLLQLVIEKPLVIRSVEQSVGCNSL